MRSLLILTLSAAHEITQNATYALGWALALCGDAKPDVPLRREGNVIYLPTKRGRKNGV